MGTPTFQQLAEPILETVLGYTLKRLEREIPLMTIVVTPRHQQPVLEGFPDFLIWTFLKLFWRTG